MIEISGVTKTYGGAAVVDDVSLSLPRGGVTALIGPNGAGKSTLLGIAARLVKPDRGTVRVDGLDVFATPGDLLARKLAILRQDNTLSVRLTVRDLVAFGRYPHSKGRPTTEDWAKVAEAIEFLALGGLEDRFLDQLSGGQRQRAFVAMAVCQDTDCVLLDEPLNGLDMKHATEMMRLIRRLADERNKTMVLVLHDINYASIHADRVVAMRESRIAFDGPPSDLMRSETLASIYDMPIEVAEFNGHRLGLYQF